MKGVVTDYEYPVTPLFCSSHGSRKTRLRKQTTQYKITAKKKNDANPLATFRGQKLLDKEKPKQKAVKRCWDIDDMMCLVTRLLHHLVCLFFVELFFKDVLPGMFFLVSIIQICSTTWGWKQANLDIIVIVHQSHEENICETTPNYYSNIS